MALGICLLPSGPRDVAAWLPMLIIGTVAGALMALDNALDLDLTSLLYPVWQAGCRDGAGNGVAAERYRAAITIISTPYFGAASLTSTVARAGVLPADTQPSHTAFISAKVFISVR